MTLPPGLQAFYNRGVNRPPAEDSPQAPRPAYDYEVAHSIWELERSARRGRVSDATRLALLDAHLEQLRMVEARLGLAEESRSLLLLQDRPSPSVLVLPGEGQGCETLRAFANRLYRGGFGVLASSLSYRVLDRPGQSPFYWQTCLDEAENRYDMLQHYATKIAVVGVGLGAAMGMHLAARRRVSAVVALFPVLDAHLGAKERLQQALRQLLPRWHKHPAAWTMQRRLATAGVRKAMGQFGAPLLALTEESGGADNSRSLRFLRRVAADGAAQLLQVPAGEAAPDTLPEATLDKVITFLKQR